MSLRIFLDRLFLAASRRQNQLSTTDSMLGKENIAITRIPPNS